MKKLILFLLFGPIGFFIFSSVLYAQTQSNISWKDAVPWLFAAAALIFGIYQYSKRRRDIKQKKLIELEAKKEFEEKEQISTAKTAEDIYRAALKEELDHIDLLGSPDIESKAVKLEDAFVTLCSSKSWRNEERFENLDREIPLPGSHRGEEGHLSPGQVMAHAFPQFQLLLVVGDQGPGKTTLLKFYAMTCLDNQQQNLGIAEENILPLYFPLRELKFTNGSPLPLQDDLEAWAKKRCLYIPAQEF